MSDLLDAAAMAERLSARDEKQVMEWHRRYHWPHVKIGRAVRWTPEQADEIVRRHIVSPAGAEPQLGIIPGQTARSRARSRRQ